MSATATTRARFEVRLRAVPWAWVGAGLTLASSLWALSPQRGARPGASGPRAPMSGPGSLHPFARGVAFPQERVLVSPLKEGDTLGPGRVIEIAHHPEAWLVVCVLVGRAQVWVQVGRLEGSTLDVPVQVPPYGLRAIHSEASPEATLASIRGVAEALRPNVWRPMPREIGPLIHRSR
jgi:hypothetical protein